MSEATTTNEGVDESPISEEISSQEVTEEEYGESNEESQEEVEVAGEEEGVEEESSSDPDKYEVTVDGEKLLLTREELMKGFQLGAASHRRFQEAAKSRKEAEAALSRIKENPLQAFLEAGGDQKAFRAIAEDYLLKQIEYDKLTPEQKELNDLRKYREEQEVERKQNQQSKQQEILARETEMYQKQFTEQYTQALNSAGLAPSEKAIQFVAKAQLDAMEAGYEMPLDLAIQYYKEEQTNSVNSYLSSLPADKLVDVIGKERMKEIRKQELSKLKNPISRKKSSSPVQKESQETFSASDFFANLS